MASQHQLGPILHPRSLVITGLGLEPQYLGHQLAQNLVVAGFRGLVRCVGVSSDRVCKLPIFSSLDELDETIEMALITDPFPRVPAVVEECLERGIKNLVIYSPGFAETGNEGHLAQSRLLNRVRFHSGKLIGPNSFGIWRSANGLNATIFGDGPQFHPRSQLDKRGITLLTSSGGLAKLACDRLYSRKVPVATVVGLGNCADLATADWLEFLTHDPQSAVVGVLFEGGGGGRRWLDAARQLARHKTVVLFRLGALPAGRQAVDRHCALPYTDVHLEDLSSQAGLVVARSFARFLDQLEIHWKAPDNEVPPRNLGILTSSGGAGVLAADAAEHRGLKLAVLEDRAVKRLENTLPNYISVGNPVDLAGCDPGARSLEIVDGVFGGNQVDAGVLILLNLDLPELVRAAHRICNNHGRPLVLVLGDAKESLAVARELNLPVAEDVEAAMNMLAALAARALSYQRLTTPPPAGLRRSSHILERELGVGSRSLSKELLLGRSFESKERFLKPQPESQVTTTQVLVDSLCRKVLLEYGLPLLEETRLNDFQELDYYAHEYGYPLILVLRPSRETFRMASPEQKARVLEELAGRSLKGQKAYLIEPRPRGDRLVATALNHPDYGPILSLKNFRTEVWRLCPTDPGLMESTLTGLGFEVNPAAMEALEKLSSLIMSNPSLTRVELNPLVINQTGAVVSGHRMVLGR